MAAPITSVEVQILEDVLSAFGLALATAVKQDAVQAVLSQGANLAALAKKSVGDVPSLVETLIEQAVAKSKMK